MEEFLLYIFVGFLAQLVDGALGMAFGLIGTSVMLAGGVAPSMASASVHAAEVFTTGLSGLSHWRFGNIRWPIVARLALPGAIGGAIGAYTLTEMPAELIKPVVNVYLTAIGVWILFRAWRQRIATADFPRWLPGLGLGGGFLDAIGGGGWGSMVTSTLIGQGTHPRYAIGTVSLSEFFVTLTVSATFMLTIGLELWPIILGLIIGGGCAAPLAAYAAKHVPPRLLMLIVGSVIIGLSVYGLVRQFG
jgi:uncharacterized membrane protein YfcA